MATATVAEVDGVVFQREESTALGIRTSRSLGQLAAALAAAQAAFPAISKDRTAHVESRKGEGSSYSYAYADLADVLSAVRPHLTANGLATLQPMVWDGAPKLMTCLIHSSGEFMVSEYRLTEYDRPQDMGSAITYARRYALTALLGIAAEEDDDGARAQVGPQRSPRQPMPACPACNSSDRVIVSKFGEGLYCHRCKGKFGTDEPEVAPGPDLSGEEWPNDTTAHERHGVEPARKPAPKAAGYDAATATAIPACPQGHSGRAVMVSKIPKNGRFYCKSCGKGYGEPA